MLARLKDPAQRERIKREMDDPNATDWENQWYGSGGGDGVMVSDGAQPDLRKYEGMTLDRDRQAEMGKDPRDAVMDLVIADRGQTDVHHRDHATKTTCARRWRIRWSRSAPTPARAGRGRTAVPASKSHPRGWGSFPRILGDTCAKSSC